MHERLLLADSRQTILGDVLPLPRPSRSFPFSPPFPSPRVFASSLTQIHNVYTIEPCGFTWKEVKRKANLGAHGLDFRDVTKVFEGPTFTFEDDRFDYSEQRFVTLGLLNGIPVSIVHTETADHIHVISFRKATKNEQILFFQNI